MGCEPLYARVLALSSIQQAYIELHGKELGSEEVRCWRLEAARTT